MLSIKRTALVLLILLFSAYSLYVYTAGTAVDIIEISDNAVKGKMLWQKYNCTSCHQIYGLGGYLGPDVTNVMSAQGKGEPYTRAMLMSGNDIMPDFNLSEDEIKALVAFLKDIDKTGHFPDKNAEINWYGSFDIY